MRTNLLLASVAMGFASLLTACLPDMTEQPPGPGSNPVGETARQDFNSNVEPLVSAKCAGCHVGAETSATNMFLGQSNTVDSHYNGITGDRAINGGFDPTSASLLTKGAHEGPAWSDSEKTTIGSWLSHELTERGGSDPDPGTGSGSGSGSGSNPGTTPTSSIDAEKQWASCMSISQTEYNSTKAYMIANMNSDNGRCYSCHEPGGAGGAYWGIDNNYLTMLTKWQEQVFITGAFQAQAQTDGSYKMITAQSKICAKGQEKNNGNGEHPAFDCNQTVGGVQPLQALEQFRVAVQAKADAPGTCPAPAFAPAD